MEQKRLDVLNNYHWTKDTKYFVRFKMNNYKQRKIYQHREIWESVYGPIPNGLVIDHINGDGHDNRLENLRAVTMQANNHNRGKTKRNTSGYKGVYWHKQHNKWHVQIMVKWKKRSLGLYDTAEDASRAYEKASREMLCEATKQS